MSVIFHLQFPEKEHQRFQDSGKNKDAANVRFVR